MDHVTAEKVLRRAVAGLDVPADELDAALAHAQACELCRPHFELAGAAPSTGGDDMSEPPVEPAALFARALTAALSAPEAVARLRAAERLATLTLVDAPALAALVRSAAEDEDEDVRAAALSTLDVLDDEISLSDRVIAAWSAAPEEAAPYLADVLHRLADPETLAFSRMARLETTEEGDTLVVRGAGAIGRIAVEDEELWLRLNRLPGSFEKSMPVVAVPAAARLPSPGIEWSSDDPGLVPAREPVTEGALDVYLGTVPPHGPLSSELFERLYLLDPRKRRI